VSKTDGVVLDRVTKRYGRRSAPAVEDLTVTLWPGTVVGLLGPNGAGKTTAVRMVVGLMRPDRGKVRVFGRDPRRPEARMRVGYVPEQPQFPGGLRANDVMDLFARLHGLDAATRRRRIVDALEWAGLAGLAKPVKSYSKGMRQRLALAQALLGEPRLLILASRPPTSTPRAQRRCATW